MNTKRILYFYTNPSPFVSKDLEILRSEYEVLEFRFDTTSKKKLLLVLLRQLLFLVRYCLSARLIVCQFAGHSAFLPVLLARLCFKKAVIVAGGTDCVSFPSIAYGNFSFPFLAFTTRFSFRYADLILPVHDTLVHYQYTYQPNDYPEQGIRYFMPRLKTPCMTVPNGYDGSRWYPEGERQPNSFITIGSGLGSRFGFALKGIDLIFAIAPALPECTFYIVGGASIQGREVPANVRLMGLVPNQELRPLLGQMNYYLQLSLSEGFPNALCEAMLCGCIPIVSAVGGMPDIVRDTGYILPQKNPDALVALIRSALQTNNDEDLRERSRNRILNDYTLQRRHTEFLQAIRQLLA